MCIIERARVLVQFCFHPLVMFFLSIVRRRWFSCYQAQFLGYWLFPNAPATKSETMFSVHVVT